MAPGICGTIWKGAIGTRGKRHSYNKQGVQLLAAFNMERRIFDYCSIVA